MAAANSVPFVIPKAIKRSKTAILKALSSTVGVDKTAPHFTFIDDPTTIPTTMRDKRSYFLAREFGRRAAQQLAAEWPTLFMFDRDKPRLEAFRPQNYPALVEAEKVDESTLRELIDAKQVSGAITVFERLRADKVKLSNEVVTDLFKLAAYYDAHDPHPTENEDWPGIRNYFYEVPRHDTNRSDLINLLYSMVEPNVSNYSTMISWICKYAGKELSNRAFEMFDEANEKNMVLEEDAYISLINLSSDAKSVNKILQAVAKLNVKPSVRLFNAAIASFNKIEAFDQRWDAIQKCLGEMARFGLKPNLTTYFNVLAKLGADEKSSEQLSLGVNCLHEILRTLKTQPSITVEQATDPKFFDAAMSVAVHANNFSLIDRVEEIYSSKQNEVKLNSFDIENKFYGTYMMKKIGAMTDIVEIEKLYMSLVPRIVGVTPRLFDLMINKLKGTKHWSLTKRVVEDGLCARFMINREFLRRFLELLDEFQPDDEKLSVIERDEFEKLVVKIVDYLLEFANFNPETDERLHLKIHPATITDCVTLLLRTTQTAKAWTLIEMLVRSDEFANQVSSEGVPNRDSLLTAFEFAMNDGNLKNASNCLELIARHNPNFKLKPYIDRMLSGFQLGNMQKQILLSLVEK